MGVNKKHCYLPRYKNEFKIIYLVFVDEFKIRKAGHQQKGGIGNKEKLKYWIKVFASVHCWALEGKAHLQSLDRGSRFILGLLPFLTMKN